MPWPDDEHPDNDVNEPLLDPQVDSPHQRTPTSEQGNYITAHDYQHVYGVTPATNNLMGTSCVSGVFVDPTKTETTTVSVEGVLHTQYYDPFGKPSFEALDHPVRTARFADDDKVAKNAAVARNRSSPCKGLQSLGQMR